MPLQGDAFLQNLRDNRIAWLGGRFGGGKTALAECIAVEFVDRGWADYIVGNFPSVLHTDLRKMPDVQDCVLVLDEAGVWLEDKKFDMIAAFLRKRNLYILLPSYQPVNMKAKALNIQRVFNGHKVGLNLWRYSAELNYMRVKEKMFLNWINPREIWGCYSTRHAAQGDRGIVKWVVKAFEAEKEDDEADTFGSDLDSVAWGRIQSMEEGGRVAEEINEAATRLEATLSEYKRKGRRRGR